MCCAAQDPLYGWQLVWRFPRLPAGPAAAGPAAGPGRGAGNTGTTTLAGGNGAAAFQPVWVEGGVLITDTGLSGGGGGEEGVCVRRGGLRRR